MRMNRTPSGPRQARVYCPPVCSKGLVLLRQLQATVEEIISIGNTWPENFSHKWIVSDLQIRKIENMGISPDILKKRS
jgi:hypothetical protein